MLQDFPQATGVHLSVPLLNRLVDDLPQIKVLKHEDCPGLGKITRIRQSAKRDGRRRISILVGNGALYYPLELARGADGAMTGFAFPELLVEVWQRFTAGPRRGRVRPVRRLSAADPLRAAAGRRPRDPQGDPAPPRHPGEPGAAAAGTQARARGRGRAGLAARAARPADGGGGGDLKRALARSRVGPVLAAFRPVSPSRVGAQRRRAGERRARHGEPGIAQKVAGDAARLLDQEQAADHVPGTGNRSSRSRPGGHRRYGTASARSSRGAGDRGPRASGRPPGSDRPPSTP